MSCPAELPAHSLITLLFPCRRGYCWPIQFHAMIPSKGQHWQSSSYPLQCVQICIFKCTPNSVLDSPLRKAGFLQNLSCPSQYCSSYETVAERGGEGLLVPGGPLPVPRSVCLIPRANVGEMFPRPTAYGAGSHYSHGGTFVHGRMPIRCLKRETKRRDILHHHDADVTPHI